MSENKSLQDELQRQKLEEERLKEKKFLEEIEACELVTIDGRPCRIIELPVTKAKLTVVTYFKTKESSSARKELLSNSTEQKTEVQEEEANVNYALKAAEFTIKKITELDGNEHQFTKDWYWNLPDDDTLKIHKYILVALVQKKRLR